MKTTYRWAILSRYVDTWTYPEPMPIQEVALFAYARSARQALPQARKLDQNARIVRLADDRRPGMGSSASRG